MATEQIINKIFGLYATRGQRHYGEDVTELQHALPCAYLARRAGDSPNLVAACLLHDYGHLLHDHREDRAEHGLNTQHEIIGADELAQYFYPLVTEPIRLHVAAKRFLCWREPEYLARGFLRRDVGAGVGHAGRVGFISRGAFARRARTCCLS